MFLEKFIIKNFRSIKELELDFNKGVNIIIGENNAGKSAIIDALRICFSYGKQWRDIGIKNDEDFYVDISEIKNEYPQIEFDLYFAIDNPKDRQVFNDMISQDKDDINKQTIQMHFRYRLDKNVKGKNILRWSVWGGDNEGQQITPDEANEIFFSYLAPLRDAEQELKPYMRGNKVTSLFQNLTKYNVEDGGIITVKELDDEHKLELAGKLEDVIIGKEWQGLLKTGQGFINEHLEKSDIVKKEAKVDLNFIEYKYENVTKSILTRKRVYEEELLKGNNSKQKYFDVSQNGLGENNLIYASAVLGDLKNRREEEIEHYFALLIEEPEAHLHPQKQNTFFNHLNSLKEFGTQIFITSHSPTITAKTDLDNLIVLQKQSNNIFAFTPKYSDLTPKNKSYLKKFLDVTKSQLFFSNGTILVEGITEALLLPVFARIMGAEYDLDKNGIEVVNVNGVAFGAFAKLYNSIDEKKRLPSKCSIITDDDRGLISASNLKDEEQEIDKSFSKKIFNELKEKDLIDSNNRIINIDTSLNLDCAGGKESFVLSVLSDKQNQISGRAQKTLELEQAGSNLIVKIAEVTFEYELFIASDFNAKFLTKIYKTLHPQFKPKGTIEEKAKILLNKLDSNKDKSLLAEKLAYLLDNSTFLSNKVTIPDYIKKGVKWVVKGEI